MCYFFFLLSVCLLEILVLCLVFCRRFAHLSYKVMTGIFEEVFSLICRLLRSIWFIFRSRHFFPICHRILVFLSNQFFVISDPNICFRLSKLFTFVQGNMIQNDIMHWVTVHDVIVYWGWFIAYFLRLYTVGIVFQDILEHFIWTY